MASPLKLQNCGAICKEDTSFSLKFVITSLKLTDDEESSDFDDILVAITFDGNVIKIEKIEGNGEGGIQFIGRGLDLRLSPEQFSEKLRTCPIMLNLSRGCIDMGTVKLEISDCFVDAVKCEEFSSETCTKEIKFVKEDEENATMTLVLQVLRENDENLFKGLKKPKKKAVTVNDEVSNVDSLSTSCSVMTLSCSTDHGPFDDETEHRATSSNRSKSTRSKCLSDIATSLDIHDYSRNQHTFCNGCGQFSISGITCDNKNLMASLPESPCKSDVKIHCGSEVKSPCKASLASNCKKSVNRICSECFEDLSVVPYDAPCPQCAFHAQLQRKLISFKSEEVITEKSEKIRDCIKSVLEEIFLDEKERLVKDWQRLKRKPKKKPKKAEKEKRRSSGIRSKSLQFNSMPR